MYKLPEKLDFTEASQVLSALREAQAAYFEELNTVTNPVGLEDFRIRWMGDKAGLINRGVAVWMKQLPGETKGSFGSAFGDFKKAADSGLQSRRVVFETVQPSGVHSLDVSLPGIRRSIGVEHPLTRTMREMAAVFAALGYSVGIGPEVETDFYNFEALNFPPNHPARDTQDTLVVADQEGKPLRERLLMRTHTSPVQIRSMVANPPPLRIVIPGKVHRNDESDATHSPIFHQVEGLCVDTDITFSDLKGTLDYAMKAFFGSSVRRHASSRPFSRSPNQARTCRSPARSAASGAAASASSPGGLSCSAAAWSILRSSPPSMRAALKTAWNPPTTRRESAASPLAWEWNASP